jgi:myo-inositol 2-dehydrogenase/D-chiro-inositol 1-dehydrogenase
VETHRQIAEDALAADKHVFCEKPLAGTVEDCQAIAESARNAGTVFGIDFHLRLSEDMAAAKRHIEKGEIGKLEILRFVMNWGCHGVHGAKGERRANFMRTGGPMLDNGVHFFDLVRWLSGSEIVHMTAEGQWVENEYEYPGHVVSVSRLGSGVLALVEMSFVYGHTTKDMPASSRMEMIGSEGVIADGRVYTPAGEILLPQGGRKRFDRIYEEFLGCVRSGTQKGSPLASADDGARATEASLEAIRIAMEGRT